MKNFFLTITVGNITSKMEIQESNLPDACEKAVRVYNALIPCVKKRKRLIVNVFELTDKGYSRHTYHIERGVM